VYIYFTDLIISLKGEVWANKTYLAVPLFIEVPVQNQESEDLYTV